MIINIIGVLIAPLLLSCSCQKSVTVLGYVKDSRGNAVSGARVEVGPCCSSTEPCVFTTDWAGRWGFSAGDDDKFRKQLGNCSYSVTKLGYVGVTNTFVVKTEDANCNDETTVTTDAILQ